MAYAQGKIAVVTGAGSGIGRALARQLNREGCNLYLSDINADALTETISMLERKDLAANSTTVDVADKTAMHAWADDIAGQTSHVDIVINNAGVALMASAQEMAYDDIEWLMGINFWGVVYGCKAFLPLLEKSPAGHLVNISSIFGIIAVPTQSAYNAAKFAVRGYTEALRQDLADSSIHVCCVHPGGIRTNIARDSRGGDPAISKQERGDAFQKMARTSAESAAAQIITAIEKRKVRLLIGADAKLMSFMARLFPAAYTKLTLALGRRAESQV